MTQQDRHALHLDGLEVVSAPYYPYPTAGGVVYAAPVTDFNANQGCQNCRHLEECAWLVCEGNGYALCEQVIAGELLPDVVIRKMEVVYV